MLAVCTGSPRALSLGVDCTVASTTGAGSGTTGAITGAAFTGAIVCGAAIAAAGEPRYGSLVAAELFAESVGAATGVAVAADSASDLAR